MRVLLSCDDVFEVLTDGCGAARADEALHEHLECCAECRQLAEATEPAADLFASALHGDEVELNRRSATSIAGNVFARLETEQKAVLAESHRRTFASLSAHAWSQLGAAVAILLALGGLFWAASPGEQSARRDFASLPAFAAPLARAAEPTEHGLLHLASLQLPETCLSRAAEFSNSAAKFQCCTRCHHAGDMLPAARLIAFSQQSCVACHKS